MVVISRRDTDDFAPLSVSWQACGTYSDVIFPGKPGLLLPLRP